MFITFVFILGSCKPSSIKVQNNLSYATIRNAEWGGIPLASTLLPGDQSRKIEIYSNDYYDIDLPEKHVLKFYIDVKGDMVYLETKKRFELGLEDNLVIEINDSTEVVNPLLEKEKNN